MSLKKQIASCVQITTSLVLAINSYQSHYLSKKKQFVEKDT